ncbi:MAG: hypothetical protein HDR21_12225 [Lachnospiraceae bacterium]|nr:hypothetical protein [Lachnospiraceae bacterium]
MTKLTFRLTTEQDKDYINNMINCMLADYEHGYLSGLEVDVSGNEGTCRIRKDRKRWGRRRIPKELLIPDFMRRPVSRAEDEKGQEALDTVENNGSINI